MGSRRDRSPSIIEQFRQSLSKRVDLSTADLDHLIEETNHLMVDLADLRRDLLEMRERQRRKSS